MESPPVHSEHPTWAGFLRSQAKVLLACDFFETRTLTGARLCVHEQAPPTIGELAELGTATARCSSWGGVAPCFR
jgi:hypothetical protein